jgi:deazaflavin-dependent oxidoreductase (nitroreductase family)
MGIPVKIIPATEPRRARPRGRFLRGQVLVRSEIIVQLKNGDHLMANTPEKISPALARQLIRDGNSDRLNTDPHAVDALNQSVIEEFRANQGRVSGPLEGWPVLLLTMTGAKTGRTLVRPVCYSRDGDRLVVIASRGGAPRNPPWYYNLVANPIVTVEVGTEKFRARAEQVFGSERTRLFDAAAEILPLFSDYQKKTSREIPVLTLTRID